MPNSYKLFAVCIVFVPGIWLAIQLIRSKSLDFDSSMLAGALVSACNSALVYFDMDIIAIIITIIVIVFSLNIGIKADKETQHQETLAEMRREKEHAEADVERSKAAMLAAEHRAAEKERLAAEQPAFFAEQVLREQIHKLYAQQKAAEADGRELDARRLERDIKALERANEIIKNASDSSEA